MKNNKQFLESLLLDTNIVINGTNPWDPQINNNDVFSRVLRHGSLGFGESYMDAWWDCDSLDKLFYKITIAKIDERVKANAKGLLKAQLRNHLLNAGSKTKAFEIAKRHYNIGNDLYREMLDKRLAYTCGYWKDANNLDEAQVAKLDLICRKLDLKPGQTVLDIGSGWGSFIAYATEKYKVKAVGVTVSKEQKDLADSLYKDMGVETRLQDYRDINEKFNHVVSIGMFEHVSCKNYNTFMKVVHRALKEDGRFLLQTIGSKLSVTGTDPWIEKYIFPNSMLPSVSQIGKSIEKLFVMEDWHSFGSYYDDTLMAWYQNFENNWDRIKSNYDERFYRMWKYYLLSSAGSFRARKNQLWQIVLTKKGELGGYNSIR